jgi:hypothetical protein
VSSLIGRGDSLIRRLQAGDGESTLWKMTQRGVNWGEANWTDATGFATRKPFAEIQVC